MKLNKLVLSLLAGATLFSSAAALASSEKLIIAHRGASGYLPEHTLESKALAFGQQADYLDDKIIAVQIANAKYHINAVRA